MSNPFFNVSGKIVVITGGLGQLGRQFGQALLKQGARVAIFDIRVDDQQVVERFGENHPQDNLLCLPVNMTEAKSIENGLSRLKETWGIPHALINNAALDSPPHAAAEENGPFEDYPEDSWDQVMKVNVKGVFLGCQIIGREMAVAGRGSIINISSIYGLVSPDQRIYEYRWLPGVPFFKPAAYGASKAALFNFTRYLSTYWAKNNVRVNTLTLGGVFNNQDVRFLQGYCAKVPLGRMANEDEYNGAIIFLISEASSYMTGANLIIDGGWTAW